MKKKSSLKEGVFFLKKESTPLAGFLFKKAHRWNLGWQKRWVEIAGRKLKYFKRATRGYEKGEYTKLRGVIDFDLVSCRLLVEENERPLRFSIEILATRRSFQFKCQTYV